MNEGDGGPAFPVEGYCGPAFPREGYSPPQTGMSLRDYFAGQALTGLLADGTASSARVDLAYIVADLMLRARNAQTS